MTTTDRLEAALHTIVGIVDPYRAGEAITLTLSHDAGMRLRHMLASDLLSEHASDDVAHLLGGPNAQVAGEPGYALDLYDVTIQWPARRIELARGHIKYI